MCLAHIQLAHLTLFYFAKLLFHVKPCTLLSSSLSNFRFQIRITSSFTSFLFTLLRVQTIWVSPEFFINVPQISVLPVESWVISKPCDTVWPFQLALGLSRNLLIKGFARYLNLKLLSPLVSTIGHTMSVIGFRPFCCSCKLKHRHCRPWPYLVKRKVPLDLEVKLVLHQSFWQILPNNTDALLGSLGKSGQCPLVL